MIYINDLSEGPFTSAKLFADDVSLFFIIHVSQAFTNILNENLELIPNWPFQWKTNFNPDSTKPAQETNFSRKTNKYIIIL